MQNKNKLNKTFNKELVLTEWLILGAQSGHSGSVDELIKLWYPKLLRYSVYQLDDREMAQDAVQECLLVMARKLHSLKDSRRFPKWIYQILHRKGVDLLRKKIRKRKLIDASVQIDENQVTGKQNTSIDHTIDVISALQKLDTDDALLVHLHYLEGLSIREIAKIVEIPSGTVKSRLYKCRQQLKEILQDPTINSGD